MVLLNTIVIDLSARTAVLNSTQSGNVVETVTYNANTNDVTFDARPYILLNFTEFLTFCDQMIILQTAVLFNYAPNITLTKPFGQVIVNELHNLVSNQWNLTVSNFTSPPYVMQYEGTRSSLKLEMEDRASTVTLTFPEWTVFLAALLHYRLSIQAF